MSAISLRSQIDTATKLASKLSTGFAKLRDDDTPSHIYSIADDVDRIDQGFQQLQSEYDWEKSVSVEATEMYQVIVASTNKMLQLVESFVNRSRSGRNKWKLDNDVAQGYSYTITVCVSLVSIMNLSVSEAGGALARPYISNAVSLLDAVDSSNLPSGLVAVQRDLRRGVELSISQSIQRSSAWYAYYVEVFGKRLPGSRHLVFFLKDPETKQVFFIVKLENTSVLKYRVTDRTSAQADDDGLLSVFSCLDLRDVVQVDDELCYGKNLRIGFRVGYFNGKPPSEELAEEFNLIQQLPRSWFSS